MRKRDEEDGSSGWWCWWCWCRKANGECGLDDRGEVTVLIQENYLCSVRWELGGGTLHAAISGGSLVFPNLHHLHHHHHQLLPPWGLTGPFQQQEEISKNEDLKRLQESNDLRRAVLPVQLMDRIKEIEAETELEISKSQSASAARQKVALELAQQLQHLKLTNSKSNQ